ncbi:MAG: phytoene desaturase family protein [Caulobacteraceae bacterium]
MNDKKIIIIGGGVAGLSAGCYLQMNGYNTEIFETSSLPGGLLTSWKRKGYTIEGSIHGLLGSSPSHPFYKLWNELIDMEKVQFIDQDIKEIYDFEYGKQFIEYADLNKLENYMKEISPEDKTVIEEFINDIRRFQNVEMPVEGLKGPSGIFKILKMVPLFLVIRRWIKVSAQDFSKKFKNPFLQEAVGYFSSPIIFEMFVLSEMDLKRCGYPSSGSLEFARLFEKKYISCNGNINYNSRVSKILVQNDKAVGIQLDNGKICAADIVISAADGRTTIFDMLEGKYVDETITRYYERAELNPSNIQVSLGLNRTFEGLPRTIKLILNPPLVINDGSQYSSIDVMIYNDTKELAPQNKTLIVVQIKTKNDVFWTSLKTQNIYMYKEEKNIISESIIEILDKRIGQIRDKIEMIDVATPATYIRYTNNWRGSTQGWSNENIFKANPFKKELPNLSSFYLCGQWVEPGGGVPAAFKSGRELAKIICKRDRKKFNTH